MMDRTFIKTALVTGATGKIGRLLTKELLRQNFRVRLFLRDRTVNFQSIFSCSIEPSSTIVQPNPNIEIFFGEITDYHSVVAAVSGVDYIFHLAALLHINNPHPSMYGKYYDVNVIGTKNIVDAASKAGVKRVVIFSTISVYGTNIPNYLHSNKEIFSDIQTFSEVSPVNPLTIYAKTKLLAEQYCSSNVTVLRIASVYGTHMAGNYLRLIQAVRRGFFSIPVNNKGLSVYRTLIHEKDVVSGAILAATHPEAAGRTYNLTDGEIHSLEDIVKAIADALSVKVFIFNSPERVIRSVANLLDILNKKIIQPYTDQAYNNKSVYIYRIINKINNSIEKALYSFDKLTENIAIDGYKIQRELGFQPKYNLQSGWSDALVKQRGAISGKSVNVRNLNP